MLSIRIWTQVSDPLPPPYIGPEFYLLELGTSQETENSSPGVTGTRPRNLLTNYANTKLIKAKFFFL
jgi:hypothetical protein